VHTSSATSRKRASTMESKSPIVLVVAHYQLRAAAETDLAAVKRFIVARYVDLYDAALIATDAWDQAHISEWETPLLGADSFLRRTFARVYSGGAAPGGASSGLPRRDLERIADSLDRDATVLVVAVQTGHPDEFTACFASASRIAQRELPANSDGEYPNLSTALEELIAPV
jgi:hypothetical protein